jgi:hypothetical protein
MGIDRGKMSPPREHTPSDSVFTTNPIGCRNEKAATVPPSHEMGPDFLLNELNANLSRTPPW